MSPSGSAEWRDASHTASRESWRWRDSGVPDVWDARYYHPIVRYGEKGGREGVPNVNAERCLRKDMMELLLSSLLYSKNPGTQWLNLLEHIHSP